MNPWREPTHIPSGVSPGSSSDSTSGPIFAPRSAIRADTMGWRDSDWGVSSEADHVQRYREALDAWNRRDLVWILEQAAPDLEFHTAQLFPGIESRYDGREGMVEFWTTFIEEPWALFRLEVASLDAAGPDRVLALLTFHGTERDSGEEVATPYAHLATFRGDEVVRIDAFADWDEARRAAGLAP